MPALTRPEFNQLVDTNLRSGGGRTGRGIQALEHRQVVQALADSAVFPADYANAGIAVSFNTRAEFVAAVGSGSLAGVKAGGVVFANGLAYRSVPLAIAIADLPGFLPDGDATVDHFGAAANLTYQNVQSGDLPGINSVTVGPRRLTGTNDLNAFEQAFAFVQSRGGGDLFAMGSYFIENLIRQNGTTGQTVFTRPNTPAIPARIIVDIYDSSGVDAETQHTLVYSNRAEGARAADHATGFTISGSTIVLNAPLTADAQIDVCWQFAVPENVRLHLGGALWTRYGLPCQGVSLESNSALMPLTNAALVIAAYSYNGFKPGDSGHMGVAVAAGSGYYLPANHAAIRSPKMHVPVVRAARVLGDSGNGIAFQDSDPSILTACFGYVLDADFDFDLTGVPYTNVASFMLHLRHWGCVYDPPGVAELINKTTYQVLTKWVPQGGYLRIRGYIQGTQGSYEKAFELAETLGVHVHSMSGTDIPSPYWIGCGDQGGGQLNADQAAAINQINTGGYFYFTGCDPDIYAIYFKGEGNSKHEVYPGTSVFKRYNPLMSWVCEGNYIECVSGTPEAIRARGVRSDRVDFGSCILKGATRAVYGIHGNGAWGISVEDGSEGLIHILNQKNVRLPQTSVDRGPDRNQTASGVAETGYESDNAAIYLEGNLYTATTTAAASAGADILVITAFNSTVAIPQPGDKVIIVDGSNRIITRVREISEDDALLLYVDPITASVGIGATVTLDQTTEVSEIDATFKSSEHGLVMSQAKAYKVSMQNAGYTGRHHVLLTNDSFVEIIKYLPSSNERRVVSTSAQSINCDATSEFVVRDADIPANTNESTPTFVIAASGADRGRGQVINCRVEAPENLVTDSSQKRRLRVHGVTDYNGVDAEERATGITYTPSLLINSLTGGITYASRTGRGWYSADYVNFYIDITLSSKGANTGPVTVSLPAGQVTVTDERTPVDIHAYDVTLGAGEQIAAYVLNGRIVLARKSASGIADMTDAHVANNSRFVIFGRARWA